MTGNPNFPTPSPTLAAIQTALNALTQAMILPGPTARDAAMLAARRTLEQMLDDLAD